jgi:hypothetical protein
MPTAVVIVEAPGGRLMFANERAARLFKFTFPAPIPNGPSPAFYPMMAGTHAGGGEYRAEDWPLARSLATGEIVTDEEIEATGADGSKLVLSVSSAPVRNAEGGTIAIVGTFFDITKRKHDEGRLADVAAGDIIAVVGEKLRTPLNAVRDWARKSRTTASAEDLGGVDVLLVEGESLTRESLRQLLESRNARVRAVDSVSAARDALAAHSHRRHRSAGREWLRAPQADEADRYRGSSRGGCKACVAGVASRARGGVDPCMRAASRPAVCVATDSGRACGG